MAKPPSIVGTWITSFIAWSATNSSDVILPFGIVNNKFVGWVPEPQWEAAWTDYFETSPDEDMLTVLSVLNPAPIATLSCFNFKEDGKFDLWVRRNEQLGEGSDDLVGDYTIGWFEARGLAGGTILVREPPDNVDVHATLEFLMVSKDEIEFIIACGKDVNTGGPSAAGTLKKVQLRPPGH